MEYLLYYIDGFIKKFPLDKQLITIGRTAENDLVVNERFISRRHALLTKLNDAITLEDMGSTNGIYIDGKKITKAKVEVGESFTLGEMDFIIKKGSLDEFKLDKVLIPIFDEISTKKHLESEEIDTRYIKDVFTEMLKELMEIGLKKEHFSDLILDLSNYLSALTDFGSFYIVSKRGDELNIMLTAESEGKGMKILKKILENNQKIFQEEVIFEPVKNTNRKFYAFPFIIDQCQASLIFLTDKRQEQRDEKLEIFLSSLAKEITLLSQILVDKRSTINPAQADWKLSDDVIIRSNEMKELAQQAQKLGKSDIFVLIQGESGTGKEVFARIIHNNSKRRHNDVVAINCAAIPENLLESDLFGHEKGAFTSAYTKKKGKLEIASGSTLILDEIGDMPINLQAKLLRALQEKEFYRLGGTSPIKVDLRIISITNQDLKRLIKEGKFREDLYYRLVHRTITIPALRERREDISALVYFFTRKFCEISNKKIKGYTVKAFEALQNYEWKGNVRQLENEISSIVNLTEDGETINYDILSDEIKERAEESTQPIQISGSPGNRNGAMAGADDREIIRQLLEKNKWNKSQTARDLGITYRGLHKKMKRIGLEQPGEDN